MFLNEPPESAWDLRFQVAGFPVRVHPLFWLMALLISGGLSGVELPILLIGVGTAFLSILVHELGHAIAMLNYGERSRIVLTAFGGLAIPDRGVWDSLSTRARDPRQQIVISAAGPFAGFFLALMGWAAIKAAGGSVSLYFALPFPIPVADVSGTVLEAPLARAFLHYLLYINIVWGFLNLVPVFPLDGGQIARQLFLMRDAWQGIRNSVILSLVVAIGIAVFSLMQRDMWLAMLFGSLAFSNWEAFQMLNGRGGRW